MRKKCSFFGKFDVLCFLEIFVLRFALLPYYRRTGKLDLQMLHDFRLDYPKKLLCGYLNIHSLSNKNNNLRVIINDVPLDYSVISKTKLENPNALLTMSNYEIWSRRDRDKHGGGLIEFVKKGLICKRTWKVFTPDL